MELLIKNYYLEGKCVSHLEYDTNGPFNHPTDKDIHRPFFSLDRFLEEEADMIIKEKQTFPNKFPYDKPLQAVKLNDYFLFESSYLFNGCLVINSLNTINNPLWQIEIGAKPDKEERINETFKIISKKILKQKIYDQHQEITRQNGYSWKHLWKESSQRTALNIPVNNGNYHSALEYLSKLKFSWR
jgi:hypothetical protein